jgi:urease accessory protein
VILSVLARHLVGLLLLAPPGLAFAHEGASLPYGSFIAGLSHPVLGLDHFLAMVSVGVVSAQIGGRAIWTVPGTFVSVMALGGLMGILGWSVGPTEIGIAVSVLILGLIIAAERRLPVLVAMAAVAVFAVFHGHAHGVEMPKVAAPVRYAAGFMVGTAALHVLGVIIGDISQHYQLGKTILRVTGGAIALAGTFFLFGSI